MKILAWPAFNNKKYIPYNWLLYTELEKLGCRVWDFHRLKSWFNSYNVFHMHWPDYVLNGGGWKAHLRSSFLLLFLSYVRNRGTKIVWTVHNLRPHEPPSPKLEAWFYKHLLNHIDGVLYLTHTSRYLAEERYPILAQIPYDITPLGHFRNVYPDHVSKNDAKIKLGIGNEIKVLLFFGQMRPYKGVENLMEIFQTIQDTNLQLWLVGRPYSQEYLHTIEQIAQNDNRIHLVGRLVPDDEVQLFLRAADLMVLPYSKILNSGSALLSLSFDCPVLVPDMGSMKELQNMIGSDWVRLFTHPLSANEMMNELDDLPVHKSPDLDGLNWQTIAYQTLAFYKELSLNKM